VGLSVPDWPTSFGYHMWGMPFSMWKGGDLYEHSHRVLASLTGFLVLALVIWLLFREQRRPVRALALACLVAVVLQGLLGGMTVRWMLPVAVSVAHGVLAQLFLCLTIVLAYALSREHAARALQADPPHPRFSKWTMALVALVFLQLVLAAYMRHDIKHQGGIAIPDFPRTAGAWWPQLGTEGTAWVNAWRENAVWEHGANFELNLPVRPYQLVVHFAHRVLALAIVVACGIMTGLAIHRVSDQRVRYTLYAVDICVLAQVLLGALTVWSNRGELITSVHVAVGALVFGATVLLALRALPPRWLETTP